MALDGLSEGLKAVGELPAISGLMPMDEENPAPRSFEFSGLKKVSYREVFQALVGMIPEVKEKYDKEMLQKGYKKQNPTGDSREALSIPREFKEIKSHNDFDEVCKSHKACAVALLPAITTIGYEKESFE